MEKIHIAILGLGTVGQGVWKILKTNKDEIIKKCGCEIKVSKILVRDINKNRKADVQRELLTTDINEILKDDSIKIVVELIGGSEPATEYMLRAMECGKHVVTANKLALATKGERLFKAAEKGGVLFYYEASVGGGIPVIRGINESLTGNKIEKIVGIVNGTTNYILTKMTEEGLEFDQALKEAQEKGYAEADPTSDIEAYDAVYKLAIMASLSFGTKVDANFIYREGITGIKSADIEYAKKLGYVIKLLAIGSEASDRLELRVHPAMVPKDHPLANVNDVFNAILINGNAVGELMLYGKGAGDLPTGSAVVGDIISVIRNSTNEAAVTAVNSSWDLKKVKSPDESVSGFYIRLNARNRPKVIVEITDAFKKYNISMVNVVYETENKDNISIVLITSETSFGSLKKSLADIKSIGSISSIENVIRIESL